MNTIKLFAFLLALLFTSVVAYSCSTPTQANVNAVARFVAAFNKQDSTAMADLVTDDIEWFSIARDEVTVEVRGKGRLVESMNEYFKSCPTCRSEISELISTPGRVSAVEIASWQGKNGQSSQKAMSVYEFSEGLINRVYYFSAEK